MKIIVLVLLFAGSLLVAGCSRKPNAPAPVVEAAPPQRELTAAEQKKEEEAAEAAQAKKRDEAAQMTAVQAAEPNSDSVLKAPPASSPATSPKP